MIVVFWSFHDLLWTENTMRLKTPFSTSFGAAISFLELRSPWPAVGKRELWEHPFQACAIDTIDADCALRSETGYAEFGYFLCYFKRDAPRALVFRPLVKENEALGTRLSAQWFFDWLKKLDNQRNCLRTSRAGFFVIVANKEEMPHFSKACKQTQRKIGCWPDSQRLVQWKTFWKADANFDMLPCFAAFT